MSPIMQHIPFDFIAGCWGTKRVDLPYDVEVFTRLAKSGLTESESKIGCLSGWVIFKDA